MRHRTILAAAGFATLALGGCVVPADDYAYDPYARGYHAAAPAYGRPYYDQRYAYAWDPTRGQWNYQTNNWNGSRWDSSPYDRYNRARWGVDRPDP